MDLTNEQREVIQLLLPEPLKRPDGRGWLRRNNRELLNGILWVMRTGAPWKDMSERYPPYQTCHRRFQEWVRSSVLEKILQALAQNLKERGWPGLERMFHRRRLRAGKKGGPTDGKDQAVQRYEIHGSGRLRWSSCRQSISSATPHEGTLIKPTLKAYFTDECPRRLIGDKSYASDLLDRQLAEQGIELIAPHRTNRKQKTQAGRKPRCYRKHWKIERLFTWLQNFRRVLVHFERIAENYLSFVDLACIIILLGNYF